MFTKQAKHNATKAQVSGFRYSATNEPDLDALVKRVLARYGGKTKAMLVDGLKELDKKAPD